MSRSAARRAPSPAALTRPAPAFVVDAACLTLFSAVGRRSHGEPFDPAGVLTTLWPFLAGLVTAWLAGRLWRAPARVAPSGLVAWGGTLVLGMLLRVASRQGVQPSFVVVAAVVLAVLLLGWRGLAGALLRRSGQAGR